MRSIKACGAPASDCALINYKVESHAAAGYITKSSAVRATRMRMIRNALHLTPASLAAWAFAGTATAGLEAKVANLAVTSPVLSHGFPDTYTLNAFGCTGGNTSPPLSWSGAPAGTKSFVITLYDPDDHDNPSGWWHLVVYDIP